MEYDSDYSVRLATLEAMGGDVTKKYKSVYDIDVAILEATEGGGGGGGIVYTAGEGININEAHEISVDQTEIQAKLTAGSGISISGNTISATGGSGVEYTAGANIQISEENVISATDTTYSAGSNVRINSANTIASAGVSAGDGVNVAYNSELNIFGVSLKPATSGSRGGVSVGSGINVTEGGQISVDTTTVQPKLTAGSNITIDSANTISATDTTYVASDFDIKDLADSTDLRTTWSAKQNALTAGANIQISGDTISATNTTYSAGTGISISAQNEIGIANPVVKAAMVTQAEYDALVLAGTVDAYTLYIITNA